MVKCVRIWQVEVLNQHADWQVKKEKVVQLLKKGLETVSTKHINKKVQEISIVFTDDKEIKRLNRIYRKKNKPTDVLSFSQLEGEDILELEGTSLGDVIISLDTAFKQAEKYEVTIEEELLRLMMHGMLHLLGYDHVDVPEAEKMRAKEDELQILLRPTWRTTWVKEK